MLGGQGENESIKEMIDKMKADHAIDDERVFVTGLSDGGAMTALMLAVWPDVFSGGAIFAGIPYGCATNKKTTAEAGECLKSYTGADAYLSRTPAQWGDLVRTAAPSFKGPYPRVSIWHGTSDSVVNNANQTELVKQWTNANGIDQTPDANDSVDGFPHAAYKDGGASTGDAGSSSGASSGGGGGGGGGGVASSGSSSSSGAAGGTSGGAGTKFTPGSAPSSCNVMVGNDSGATLLVLGAALGLVRAARRRSRASRS